MTITGVVFAVLLSGVDVDAQIGSVVVYSVAIFAFALVVCAVVVWPANVRRPTPSALPVDEEPARNRRRDGAEGAP